jgi:hypothetical protein
MRLEAEKVRGFLAIQTRGQRRQAQQVFSLIIHASL